MKRELPIYEIFIDLNEEDTFVDFNSLVLDPAHEISFQMFSNQKRFQFNDEEQVITGVAISADTPIYRYDSDTNEEYYVVFTKKAIKDIIFDYARRGNYSNVNIEHNGGNVIKGIHMIHSYQVDKDRGFTAPERFKDVNDGSWITSYKVTDPEIWAKAKAGQWTGFSIEGVFQMADSGKTVESEMMAMIYQELKKMKDYINFYSDYPEAVSNNAKRGIELNERNGNKCATRIGRLRATTLSNRESLSVDVIKRMYSYLSRAEEYYNPDDTSACGTISYLLWGGLAGKRWAESKLKELGVLEQ